MVTRCTDEEILTRIAHHPRVKKFITDDMSFGFVYDPNGLYLAYEDKGFVSAHPLSAICYQVHIALMPELWGRGVEMGQSAASWIFTNTACQKLIAIIPAFNKLAIKIALGFGRQEGIITKSFSKGLKLHDQIVLGLTKEEWICHQQ